MTYYDLTLADRWFAVYENDSIPVAVWAVCEQENSAPAVLGLVPHESLDCLIPAYKRLPGFKYYARLPYQMPNE